ncbi:MAG: hypothetical protein JSV78_13425 [Phycisphaerales bacterium]|nr:MAG: hypothetical protein JSV78_13425 [Phycisphaerales bacterium]
MQQFLRFVIGDVTILLMTFAACGLIAFGLFLLLRRIRPKVRRMLHRLPFARRRRHRTPATPNPVVPAKQVEYRTSPHICFIDPYDDEEFPVSTEDKAVHLP